MRILGGFFFLKIRPAAFLPKGMRNPAGFSFSRGDMETYNKPPLTFRQQVDLLVNRGLFVSDLTNAEQFLSQVNYYRLNSMKSIVKFEVEKHRP
jgi:hypothetical protein